MADHSKIEWTDATWNPIRARNRSTGKLGWHCEHVSEGCRDCYAESMNRRLGTGLDFKPGHLASGAIEIFLDETMLMQPLRWKRPRKIFVGSMTDLFAPFVTDAMLDRVFAVMALASKHTFQLLTKRPERMRRYVNPTTCARIFGALVDHPSGTSGPLYDYLDMVVWPLPNIWLGVSCEDQAAAVERIPHLLAAPANVRFLSCEPLLGPIDLTGMCNGWYFTNALTGLKYHDAPERASSATDRGPRIDWVIAGGESGPHARPMHPDWARSLRDQCAAAGTAFHFKQWGEWHPNDHALRGDTGSTRWGKKRSGRLLDGVEHNGFPQ